MHIFKLKTAMGGTEGLTRRGQVYGPDDGISEARAKELIAAGLARLATPAEIKAAKDGAKNRLATPRLGTRAPLRQSVVSGRGGDAEAETAATATATSAPTGIRTGAGKSSASSDRVRPRTSTTSSKSAGAGKSSRSTARGN